MAFQAPGSGTLQPRSGTFRAPGAPPLRDRPRAGDSSCFPSSLSSPSGACLNPHATRGLSLQDSVPSHLQKREFLPAAPAATTALPAPGALLQHRPRRVTVIRNCGSNTLNFEFYDTAPRLACNGATEPRRTAPGSSVSDWYQTWPAKEMKKPSAQVVPVPLPPAGSALSPLQHGPPPAPRPAPWSATWTKDSKRKDKRWVKYDGIGPVDESGMPIASRSSVDRPRDWYRSMFQQIHRKLPEPQLDWDFHRRTEPPTGLAPLDSACLRRGLGAIPAPHPHQLFLFFGPRGGQQAAADAAQEPRSIFDYEPGKSSVLDHPNPAAEPRSGSGESWYQFLKGRAVCTLPPQVLLERELKQLSEALDEDMKAMETQWDPREVPPALLGQATCRGPVPLALPSSSSLSHPAGPTGTSWGLCCWLCSCSRSLPSTRRPQPAVGQSPPAAPPHPPASPGMESGGLAMSDWIRSPPRKDPLGHPGKSPVADASKSVEGMDGPVKREEKKMKAARLKFDFVAESPKELTLQKGDIVYIHKEVDRNWYRAVYQYRPQNEDELELQEGDRVDVMQQCDDGWFVGTFASWEPKGGGSARGLLGEQDTRHESIKGCYKEEGAKWFSLTSENRTLFPMSNRNLP
nr:vinexin [Pelodiscus sinensis]|eukprot:XP_025046769.1 vinexin [Pelodiscus sinensis]